METRVSYVLRIDGIEAGPLDAEYPPYLHAGETIISDFGTFKIVAIVHDMRTDRDEAIYLDVTRLA